MISWPPGMWAPIGNGRSGGVDVAGKRDVVVIFTDGGCEPNPGVGGWAAVLIYHGKRKELSGGELDSTNNRMELTAVIEALGALKRSCEVLLNTDSQYVKKGITEWLPGWKKNQWRRKRGELKNVDLWKRLDALAERHDIKWQWVPGHAGVTENERCDELATSRIARLKAEP